MRQHDRQQQDDQQAGRTPVQVDDRDWPDDPDLTDDPDRRNGRDTTDNPDRVDDLDRTEYHEPAPLPTTFGAPTVSGAVAASALASGNRTDEFDARDDETVGPDNGRADGRASDTTTTDSGTATATPATSTPDTAAPGTTAPGTTAPGTTAPGTTGSGTTGSGTAAADAGVSDTALPGATAPDGADGVGPLLDPDAIAGLRDRWREVQLRFVDDPQAALGEARGLVGEAVDSLTSAIADQRDRLDQDGDGADDAGETERIRLRIRRYRDFLDRVLAH
ncbi:hypothetical protein OG792_27850 [Micromonospora sp. NBC_01699]|uniref:hypothetical protein n=1 Tax=Micromonospora sp. NBC_01699 TaxID=2975984 RepID=UPI002E2886AB|nr:hypothetical protein [Micromonospora sp. NBC_01699]